MITIEKRNKLIHHFVILVSFFAITFIWYRNNKWSVLMGDDLIAIGNLKEVGFWRTLFSPENISLGKVRPVSTILLYFIYLACGLSYKKYYFVLRLLLVISAFVIFELSKRTGVKEPYAYSISLFFITCPFSAYGVWQALGILEIFSLLCSIFCSYYQYKVIQSPDKKSIRINAMLCTIAFALLIFNAERFMYLVAVFILVILANQKINYKEKAFLSVLYFSPIICRSILLHIAGSSTMETGRGNILTLFSTLGIYALKGFVNMLGFSLGDQWHGGFTLQELPLIILIISSLRVVVFIGIGFIVLINLLKSNYSKKYFEILIMYLFSLTSLFSYALVGATHGEDRFLWIPYIYYLFALTKYISNCEEFKMHVLSIALVALTILISNFYYITNKVHVHFRYSQEMAQTCIENIKNLENYETVQNVCCVKPNDYFWIFGNQLFFNLYVSENTNVFYYDSFDEIDAQLKTENTIVVFIDEDYPIPYGTAACWIGDL